MKSKLINYTKADKQDLRKTGVYAIVNLLDNKFYIGSAAYCLEIESQKGFYRRWYQHFYRLEKGIHHCIYLQRAWIKYGLENFEFRILEFVTSELCIEVEQNYLDLANPNLLYNMCGVAGSSLGTKRSQEEIDAKSKYFELVTPEGNLVQCKNMKQFCRDNKLQQASLDDVLKGKQLHHAGWTKDQEHHKIYKKAYELRGICHKAKTKSFEVYINSKFIKGFKSLEEAKAERDKAELASNKKINPKGFKNWKELVKQVSL